MSRDIQQEVTDSILAIMERGTLPWRKDWDGRGSWDMALPHNPATKRQYHGINILLLWASAQKYGYQSNAWMTYKQAVTLGGNVRKGERGTMVVLWKPFTKRGKPGEPAPDPTDKENQFWMVRHFTVFNVEQCEGLTKIPAPAVLPEVERLAYVEEFLGHIGATVRHGGDRAYFSPTDDYIGLPAAASFKTLEGYYATSLHEHSHWTGHKSRLNRLDKLARFGSESYAAEELVAELGAAFLCAELGIASDLENHASYLANWIKVLKADKRAIFTAAGAASKAAEFLKAKQPAALPAESDDEEIEAEAA